MVYVRSTGAWQFCCLIFFFCILAHFEGSTRSPASSRAPASVVSDCFDSVKNFLGRRPLITRAWSKVKRVKAGYKLDYDLLNRYRDEYSAMMEDGGVFDLREVNPSSEALLGYIEALNKQLGGDHVPELKNMNIFRRRKVANIVETLNSKRGPLMNDLEELIGELYLAAYGPSMKANEVLFEDNIEKWVLARVIQEDMASRGLLYVFSKYRILNKKKTWVQKFIRSKTGRVLGNSVMNLGVLWGLPPIYLPKLRQIKIPDHLVQDLIENGMSKETMTKLEQEIGRLLGDQMTFSLQNRARYRLFRRYYMAGISAYLTYMMVMEFYETNSALQEEAEALAELAEEMTSTLEAAEELEAKGYSIFEKTEEHHKDKVKTNRWCKAILECVEYEEKDLGEKIERGSETYKACKDFMDPENLCPSM